LNLLDGDLESIWSSAAATPFPHSFVIELPQAYRLRSIVMDNTHTQEPGYPGISAKTVEIWLSNRSAKEGFTKAASGEVAQGARGEIRLASAAAARWVKVVVTANHGNGEYTEIGEIEGYGEPVGPVPPAPPITGSYATNYGPLYLSNDGGRIYGCYPAGSGTVLGATDGRTLDFEWRQGTRVGTCSMVLSSDGAFLNGYWYEGGQRRGVWAGQRTSGQPGTCTQTVDLSSSLGSTGRAVVYGIHFDSDSDRLRPDSDPALEQLLAALKGSPGMKVRIEGHTDSTNTDAYNLDLSRRRAQAVVAWLVAHGIAAERLASEGFGKSRPAADNSTPQGRALNRRVEVVVVK